MNLSTGYTVSSTRGSISILVETGDSGDDPSEIISMGI